MHLWHTKCAISFDSEKGSERAGRGRLRSKTRFPGTAELTPKRNGDTRSDFFEFRLKVKKTQFVSFENLQISFCYQVLIIQSSRNTTGFILMRLMALRVHGSKVEALHCLSKQATHPGAQINARNLIQGSVTNWHHSKFSWALEFSSLGQETRICTMIQKTFKTSALLNKLNRKTFLTFELKIWHLGTVNFTFPPYKFSLLDLLGAFRVLGRY